MQDVPTGSTQSSGVMSQSELSAQRAFCYEDGDETGGLDMEEKRE